MNLVPDIEEQEGPYACGRKPRYLFHRIDSADAAMAAVTAAATPPDRGAERFVHLHDEASTGQSA
jgi:hypothetical protein